MYVKVRASVGIFSRTNANLRTCKYVNHHRPTSIEPIPTEPIYNLRCGSMVVTSLTITRTFEIRHIGIDSGAYGVYSAARQTGNRVPSSIASIEGQLSVNDLDAFYNEPRTPTLIMFFTKPTAK